MNNWDELLRLIVIILVYFKVFFKLSVYLNGKNLFFILKKKLEIKKYKYVLY